jgi:hypothetical protein
MTPTLSITFGALGEQAKARAAWAAWIALLLLICGVSARAATPTLDVTDPYKSVFVEDPAFGKDPFFPNSTRRGRVPVAVAPKVLNVETPELFLKGLSGTPDRRLAIINNYTFQSGEESLVRVAGVAVKVRCIEIRERSVIVSINGITKELKLRPKI